MEDKLNYTILSNLLILSFSIHLLSKPSTPGEGGGFDKYLPTILFSLSVQLRRFTKIYL